METSSSVHSRQYVWWAIAAAAIAWLCLVMAIPQLSLFLGLASLVLLAALSVIAWFVWASAEVPSDHAEMTDLPPPSSLPFSMEFLPSSDFLSRMGHDLRQPLQAASLYAATLAAQPLPEKSTTLVASLETALDMFSQQFEMVMALAKLEAGRLPFSPQSVTLGAVFNAVVAQHLALAHERGLHFRQVFSRQRVMVDALQFARVIELLVLHAIHSTESGGVLLGARRASNAVVVEVRDSGESTPIEQRATLFVPFSTAGARLTDRGLGLVLAERLVRMMGGTLHYIASRRQGNIYRLRFPLR